MKNLISFLCVALFTTIAFSGHAGNKFGLRGGYQMSAFYANGSMAENTDNLSSFYIGAFKENQIIPLLDFGFGLDYMQNGAELSDYGKYTINYLSVPLYVKAKIGPVFGLTGLGLSFKLSDNLSNGEMETEPSDYNTTNDFDVPLFIGAGVKILMFTVEARYNWGMLELNGVTGAKNQYMQVGVGLSF